MSTAAPLETYHLLEKLAVKKSHSKLLPQIMHAILAGMYVSLGGHCSFYFAGSLGVVDANTGKYQAASVGMTKFCQSCLFPFGIIACVVTGAELFTSNTMVFVAGIISKQTNWKWLVRSWTISWVFNFIGSLLTLALLSYLPETFEHDEHLKQYVIHIAETKGLGLPLHNFVKAIGCNILVCLSVWLIMAASDGAGKVLMAWFPIVVFIMCSFEHSIANMYGIPLGMCLGAKVSIHQLFVNNLLPVTCGNIIGGGIFIGAVYAFAFDVAYREHPRKAVAVDDGTHHIDDHHDDPAGKKVETKLRVQTQEMRVTSRHNTAHGTPPTVAPKSGMLPNWVSVPSGVLGGRSNTSNYHVIGQPQAHIDSHAHDGAQSPRSTNHSFSGADEAALGMASSKVYPSAGGPV
eukprot:GDKI01047279.1.p1 GENE.GDKI01047279.1~~GDKI01047279.1.p1  ORF type:complete len:404 (-),score=89.56 GDKI01047279.1:22-1233(-)